MKRAARARLLLAAALAASLPAAAAERLPRLADEAVVLAFGDSLTAGIGGSGSDYPSRLAARIGREVVNVGIPGETTAGGAARLPRALAELHPALLILCLGVNDFLRGVPREQVAAQLDAMLDAAQAAGVPVLLLAVPATGQRVADPLFLARAARPGVVVDAVSMVGVLGQPALKADPVHPNAEGYRRIADAVALRLRVSGAWQP